MKARILGRRSTMPGRQRDERGAATTAAFGFISVMSVMLLGVLVALNLFAAHRAAQNAADLSALAAAQAIQDGGSPCAQAGDIAQRNGGELTSCDLDGDFVLVTVHVKASAILGQQPSLQATAWAGPTGGDAGAASRLGRGF